MLAKSMKWIFVSASLLAACTALAQINASRSPAGEPPLYVRNGTAKLVGHFSNPNQMLRLAFGLTPPHLAEEKEFLQELMTPGSPQFRQFLTPEQWQARFAPSVEDEQAVVDWATGQGLAITQRWPNRLIVDVEAPIATIEKALQVKINNYQFNGYTYFSNERGPVIPAHLSGIIHMVAGLYNFPRMHPANFSGKQHPPGPIYTPGPVVGVGHTFHADGNGAKLAEARAQSGQTSAPQFQSDGAADPTNIWSAAGYDYDALHNVGYCCNPLSYVGGLPAGLPSSPPESSIALGTFGNLHTVGGNLVDIQGFSSEYPYLAINVTTIPINGGTTWGANDDDGETALDSEWSTAMSNSQGTSGTTAHVYVYEDGGWEMDMYEAMMTDGYAKIFSESWGWAESAEQSIPSWDSATLSEMETDDGLFSEMAGEGWTLMSSSGDQGATGDCATISVEFPASDPNLMAVGGTSLQLYSDGSFDQEPAWIGEFATGSCTSNHGGSTGGCSQYFDTPVYQSGMDFCAGTAPGGVQGRSVPDISLEADASHGVNIYFNGSWGGLIGGTSLSSPMLAGFFAQEGAYLVHLKSVTGNKCGVPPGPCTPMGNGNTYLYAFGQNPTSYPHIPFYDITVGCNDNDITVKNHLTGYFCAGPGYDQVTGWGSANMLQLAWAINTFIAGDGAPPTVDFSGSPTISHWYNTSQNVQWSIAGATNNGAVPNGVAGFSAAWDADVGDDTYKARSTTSSSYFSGPQTPKQITGSLTLGGGSGQSGQGCHTAHVRAWDNGGTTSDNTYGPVCFDNVPPTVNCTKQTSPVWTTWYATDVTYSCSAFDPSPGSGLKNPTTDTSFGLSTNVSGNSDTTSAMANPTPYTVYDNAGNSTSVQYGPFDVDKRAPVVTCTSTTPAAPTYKSWYPSNVTENCNSTDGTGSGLKNSSDASFGLSTSVTTNTEISNAQTPSHAVPDNVNNSTTVGPFTFSVDMKPPTIAITQPAAAPPYLHSGTLTLNYTVNDYGSGVKTYTPTMNGSSTFAGGLKSGTVINLLTALPLGSNTFKISATDNVNNNDSASVTFTIIVTPQSIITDVSEFVASHTLSSRMATLLLVLLNAALEARNAGQCGTADNFYEAFISFVQASAHSGQIPATTASILIADAQYLISHCP